MRRAASLAHRRLERRSIVNGLPSTASRRLRSARVRDLGRAGDERDRDRRLARAALGDERVAALVVRVDVEQRRRRRPPARAARARRRACPPRAPRSRRARDSPCRAAESTARRRRRGRRVAVDPPIATRQRVYSGPYPDRPPCARYHSEDGKGLRAARGRSCGRGGHERRCRRLAAPDSSVPAPGVARVPARARPARAAEAAADERARPTRLSRAASVVSRPSSSMLSKRPGEIFEPVTATRIGWNACRGFRPSSSAAARSAVSIASAVNGSSVGERRRAPPRASAPPPSSSAGSGSTSSKKKPANAGELAEPRDLLLHERRRPRDAARRPSRSRARRARGRARARTPAAGARGGRRRSSSRASRSRTAPGSG